jgi:hypothetical protein
VDLAAGAPAPRTPEGDALLGHEVAHLLLQSGAGPEVPEAEAEALANRAGLRAAMRLAGGGGAPAGAGLVPGGGVSLRRCSRPTARLDRATPLTAQDAREILDYYRGRSDAERRSLFERYYPGGGIGRVLRALPAADATGAYREPVQELLRWAQEAATRAAAGQTDEQIAEAQREWMRQQAEAEARAVTGSAAPTEAEVEQERRQAVEATSIAPAVLDEWAAMPQAQRDAWTARGAAAISAVTAFSAAHHPELGLTAARFRFDYRAVQRRGAHVLAFADAGPVAVVGRAWVEAVEHDPAYGMSIVVHELFGHEEYGAYGTEYHLALYDRAMAGFPGYARPAAGTEARRAEIDAYAYQETEIYALLRSLPYHRPVTAAHRAQGVVEANPEALVRARVALMRRQWAPTVLPGLLRGMQERFRLDPRITPAALAAFEAAVNAEVPGALGP